MVALQAEVARASAEEDFDKVAQLAVELKKLKEFAARDDLVNKMGERSGSVTPFLLGSRHGKQTLTTDDRPQLTEEEIAEKRAASAKKRLKNREWLCDDCGNWNFGRRCDCFQLKPIAFICNVFVVPWGRTECNRCSKPRPAGAGRKPQGAATRLTTSTAQWSDEPGPRAAGSLKTCERGPPLVDSHAHTHGVTHGVTHTGNPHASLLMRASPSR
jgi:hypothetical protein